MKKYFLSINQETPAIKAILFDMDGQLVYCYNTFHKQHYPNSLWLEQDPEDIYEKTLDAIEGVLFSTDISQEQIAAISIANQRQTALIWDKYTGKPVYNAISSECLRGSKICNQLKAKGYDEIIKEKTGLPLSPCFSASKLKWILDNVQGVREKAASGELIFGTIDSWLIWKLTGGALHATDYTNACRTQLFNLKELKWDNELFEMFDIPSTMAPEIRFSDSYFGSAVINRAIKKEIPIAGVISDSQGEAFAHNCFYKGSARASYDDGAIINLNIGTKLINPGNGLAATIAWGVGREVEYMLEGNITCAGSTIKWLVENMEIITNPKVSGQIAASIKENGGVYIVPAFMGLGAPYNNSHAKVMITGITEDTGKAHLVRAAEEAIAYQVKDMLNLMTCQSGVDLKELYVDGSPTGDSFLMQFQTNILNVPVIKNNTYEPAAAGSVYMAGLATGVWNSIEDLKMLNNDNSVYQNLMPQQLRDELYEGWKKAVLRTSMNI
jgi:glycerol kinase